MMRKKSTLYKQEIGPTRKHCKPSHLKTDFERLITDMIYQFTEDFGDIRVKSESPSEINGCQSIKLS